MRATGIVRRIDDLGRVVIPKEIRRNLRIKEGDPLELFVDNNSLILQKYVVSYSEELTAIADNFKNYIGNDFPYEKREEFLKFLENAKQLIKEYEETR